VRVVGIWLFKTVASVFVLLMLGVLVSLYLGAVAEWIERRTQAPRAAALTLAILGTLGGLALLVWILAPPVVDQTRKLIESLPTFIAAWESGIDQLAARFPALGSVIGTPGEHKTLQAAYGQLSGVIGVLPTKLIEIVHAAINVFAIGVMAIYLSLHPSL